MGELLRTHRPPLATRPAHEVIAGLVGMRYGLYKEDQSARRRIWALYHPLGWNREGDAKVTAIMELGAITAEKDCNEEYRADNQLQENSDKLFFAHPRLLGIRTHSRVFRSPQVRELGSQPLHVLSL